MRLGWLAIIWIVLFPALSHGETKLLGYPGRSYLSVSGMWVQLEDSRLDSQNATLGTVLRAIDAQIETERGFGLSFAPGFRWNSGFALEGEYTFKKVELERGTSSVGNVELSGNLKIHTFMFNAKYFVGEGSLKPYAGAGLGMGLYDSNQSDVTKTPAELAWQVFAGLNYEIGNRWNLNLGYRYQSSPDPDFGGYNAEIGAHQFEVGLIFFLENKSSRDIKDRWGKTSRKGEVEHLPGAPERK